MVRIHTYDSQAQRQAPSDGAAVLIGDPPPPAARAADVCIVGAGPAGISIARELIGSGLQVIVLESGGYDLNAWAQDLSGGEIASDSYAPDAVAAGRRRQFGGTSNLWIYNTDPGDGRKYARSVPPEAIDFEPREGSDGWPVSLAELAPYYPRAQATWNGAPYDYDVERWAGDDARPLALPGSPLTTKISQHGPNDVFSLRYRDDLLAAANITVLAGCTALGLDAADSAGVIRRVKVGTRSGERFAIEARAFVLAAGGIENVQLLLLSAAARPGAPGNRHDVIGRYLTDHPEFRLGTFAPAGRAVLDALGLYDLRWVDRFLVSGFLAIDEQTKRREQLLNVSAALVLHGREFGSPTHRALAALRAPRRREQPRRLGRELATVLANPRTTAGLIRARGRDYQEWRGGWSGSDVDRSRLPIVEAHAASEQSPEPENRIVLSDERDRFGRARVSVQWRWSEADRANVMRSLAILTAGLEAAGLGRRRPWGALDGPERPFWDGIHHPMGGTRMHPDPARGAVDVNCRVHGLANVWVAGSSVFPTGHGYANPTLTLLALATRLADHLRAELGAPSTAR
jgi:choline dehydrogenase-like flavoprotein